MCASNCSKLEKFTCEYCGDSITFQASAKGQKAECPHCGRVVQLGAVLPAVLEMRKRTGVRVEKLNRTRIPAVTLLLGWPLFGAGFLAILSSMVTPLIGGDALARALGLFLSLLATGIGLALMLESRHTQTYWVCSACASKLANRDAIVCGTCAAEFE